MNISEDTSIRIMTIEFYLIVVPMILLFLGLTGFGLQVYDSYFLVLGLALSFVFLSVGSYLIIQFIIDGRDALLGLSTWLFYLPCLGAVWVLFSAIALFFNISSHIESNLEDIFVVGLYGIPLLIPFTHLMTELYASKKAV